MIERDQIIKNNEEYEKTCDVCDNKIEVIAHKDNNPEYYTDVYVMCRCGNYIQFELPVN